VEQLAVIKPSSDDLADQLLVEDGVFHVVIVDRHSAIAVNRAKDVDISTSFLHGFRDAAMRLSTVRTGAHVDHDPVGTFRLAFLEYDRIAVLLLPDGDRTVGIALLKEHATGAFLDHAKALIANARAP
jgi:hypothetical protein